MYRILLDCGPFVPQSNGMWDNKIIRVFYVIRENPRFRQQVSTKTLHTLFVIIACPIIDNSVILLFGEDYLSANPDMGHYQGKLFLVEAHRIRMH